MSKIDIKKKITGKHIFFNIKYILVTSLIVINILTVTLGIVKWTTLFFTIPIMILFDFFIIFIIYNYHKEQRLLLYRLSKQLTNVSKDALYNFPMPTLCVSSDGNILWYNDSFKSSVSKDMELIGEDFSLISSEKLDDFCNRTGIEISFNKRYYHVKATYDKKASMYVLYFEDNTNLIEIANKHEISRPHVMMLMIDNYDEIFDSKKESFKSNIIGKIDSVLENFIGNTTGFIKRLSKDKFLIVLEKKYLDEIIKDKFSILDEIREIGIEEKSPITLSIGVGTQSETLDESDVFAQQALDMALGRGGDQAAVKTTKGFDFYGGVSEGVEKRTRVKSRVIATALRELIDQSDKVILMGHRFGDLDSIGSAIGLCSAVRKLGKEAYIAASYKKTLAVSLLNKLNEAGFNDWMVHPDDAIDMIDKKTLLIIVDTHNPDFLESVDLYNKALNVAVIDHHRKMVNYIDRALIFYHEPYASSTSELVAELVQYLGDCKLGAMEAESMLAGIMLDTKNFVIKAGVRTFEAAAYLKSLGADTVSVRKLFSNTMDSYQKKSRIVSGAETYRNCAIAIGDFQSDDMRIVAPQAADELLGISGVVASFVIYMTDNTVNISARSLGDINAQVIMERFGGGGHHTQAACQIEDVSIEKARQMLLEAIDNLLDSKEE